jgi:hypothetical protein
MNVAVGNRFLGRKGGLRPTICISVPPKLVVTIATERSLSPVLLERPVFLSKGFIPGEDGEK